MEAVVVVEGRGSILFKKRVPGKCKAPGKHPASRVLVIRPYLTTVTVLEAPSLGGGRGAAAAHATVGGLCVGFTWKCDAMQSKAKQSKAKQSKAKQSKAKQSKATCWVGLQGGTTKYYLV